jgi:2-keto-4-pentenoate hydratase/2-oxohepta-3-ene-1,7-dioic acid hydratase in catechol pathway
MRKPPAVLVTAMFPEGPPRPGVLTTEGVVPVDGDPFRAPAPITTARLLAAAAGRRPLPARLLLPFVPGKVLAVGRNYAAHAKELGNEVPEAPFFFSKAPSSAIGPDGPIVIPWDLEGDVHHEAELAVVIGRRGRRIPRASALGYVAGYMAANDVTARTLQGSLKERKLPWFSGKNLDTFLVLGPGLVPADAVADPAALRVSCLVNGELRQDAPTSLMLNDVAALIEHASRHLTLEPLDVLLTGTPAGVGLLAAGDAVTVRIDGVGEFSNPVIREGAPAADASPSSGRPPRIS